VIAGEAVVGCSQADCSSRGGAVGDEAGDGAVGVGQPVSAVDPADELPPALVVGQGVFDGDAVGRVPVAVAFSACVDVGKCTLVRCLYGLLANAVP
jgi:hypothetical protein